MIQKNSSSWNPATFWNSATWAKLTIPFSIAELERWDTVKVIIILWTYCHFCWIPCQIFYLPLRIILGVVVFNSAKTTHHNALNAWLPQGSQMNGSAQTFCCPHLFQGGWRDWKCCRWTMLRVAKPTTGRKHRFAFMGALPFICGAMSSTAAYGSQRKCSSKSMVHCPTIGLRPKGLWSITLRTSDGVYNSSFGNNYLKQEQHTYVYT